MRRRAAVCVGKPCNWVESIRQNPNQNPNDARWGYIDTSGKLIVTPQYAFTSEFSEGRASVLTEIYYPGLNTMTSGGGYIDRDGKLVIPMQFGIVSDFKEGLARVCIGKCGRSKDYDGKYGFIDHSVHSVINPQYDDADDFKNGFASVTLGKGDDAKTGYIDKTGKTIWQPSN